jgi:cytochrome P450
MKQSGSYMSFGDGPHRCPGAQLALHETRVFLDKMLRLPGIRLTKRPRVGWDESIMGYELRDRHLRPCLTPNLHVGSQLRPVM